MARAGEDSPGLARVERRVTGTVPTCEPGRGCDISVSPEGNPENCQQTDTHAVVACLLDPIFDHLAMVRQRRSRRSGRFGWSDLFD